MHERGTVLDSLMTGGAPHLQVIHLLEVPQAVRDGAGQLVAAKEPAGVGPSRDKTMQRERESSSKTE